MKVSIVIPACTEEENVPEVAARVKEQPGARYERELPVVDDAPGSNTQRVLREPRAQDAEIHHVLPSYILRKMMKLALSGISSFSIGASHFTAIDGALVSSFASLTAIAACARR